MDYNLIDKMMFLVPLLLSLSVHECAHAWSAWRLGDDTAKLMGRMTLNPIPHIDILGTIILPLAGVPFGWAKPVPVNPMRFRRDIKMETGMLLTAIAGPLSNLAMALIAAVLIFIFHGILSLTSKSFVVVYQFLNILVYMNVILAVFNMLPIPPLDGSRVANALIPDQFRDIWNKIQSIGPFLLLAVLFIPRAFGFGILDGVVDGV
ncbi:MAG: site-2 protease family protein, partial [bacterium]|nr:site-2 protease family protein [bacterium]